MNGALARSALTRATVAGTVALVALALLWELALAPLRPGGSWLALKAVPLALLLPGIAQRTRRGLQWLAIIVPLYFAEGLVRAMTETGRHALVAGLAAAIAAATFAVTLASLRGSRDEAR